MPHDNILILKSAVLLLSISNIAPSLPFHQLLSLAPVLLKTTQPPLTALGLTNSPWTQISPVPLMGNQLGVSTSRCCRCTARPYKSIFMLLEPDQLKFWQTLLIVYCACVKLQGDFVGWVSYFAWIITIILT